MSSKKKSTSTTQSQQSSVQTLDPAVRNAVFGADGAGGFFGAATDAFQNSKLTPYAGPTYAGLNPTQQGALGGTLDYLKSPAANAGYNALTSLGNQLSQFSPGQLNLPGISAQNVSASPITAASIDPSTYGSKVNAPKMDAATVGGSGFNYGSAVDSILSGKVDNPQLRGMMTDTANVSTENFLRNVLPQIRAQSRLAGGYGDSKDAIAQTLGASDLNNSIQRSNTGLLGNLWESAQNRRAGLAGQLAGQDAQARQASAGFQQQANAQNAGFDLQSQLANLERQMSGAQFNAGLQQQAALANQSNSLAAQTANQGANLQAAGLTQSGLLNQFGLNNEARQQAVNNQLTGANALQAASQIPLQNFQTALNVGNAYQQDQQGQYSDAYQRFMQNQMLPWQNLNLYQSAIGPFATLGSGQNSQGTSTTTTKESTGGLGNALGTAIGLGSMFMGNPMGALGGLGGGSLGGLFGSIFKPPTITGGLGGGFGVGGA